jgi:hypothetical protein
MVIPTYRSDTDTRCSSMGKWQGFFFRAHLAQGLEPEHLTFIERHLSQLDKTVSLTNQSNCRDSNSRPLALSRFWLIGFGRHVGLLHRNKV